MGFQLGARGLSTRDVEDTFTWPPAALARGGAACQKLAAFEQARPENQPDAA